MAQYFTERLQKVFHMIFTSYNQNMAQEGLRQLELIVNNQQNPSQLKDRALRNDKTSRLESDIDTKEDALKIANDSEARELGDAYALLARVYAGPRFTWEESNFPEDNMRTYQCLHDSIRRCSPIGTLQALRIKGSITPTVEKDMQISFNDAFRIVYDHANRGDAYCQYVIGNVFFWRDDNRIDSAEAMLTPPLMSWTKRIKKALQQTLYGIVSPPYKAPCQTKNCKKMHLTWRKNGLIRLSTTVLPCSKETCAISISTKPTFPMRAASPKLRPSLATLP